MIDHTLPCGLFFSFRFRSCTGSRIRTTLLVRHPTDPVSLWSRAASEADQSLRQDSPLGSDTTCPSGPLVAPTLGTPVLPRLDLDSAMSQTCRTRRGSAKRPTRSFPTGTAAHPRDGPVLSLPSALSLPDASGPALTAPPRASGGPSPPRDGPWTGKSPAPDVGGRYRGGQRLHQGRE